MTVIVEKIRQQYTERYKGRLVKMAEALEEDIRENVSSCTHIDRISVRAKAIERFCRKAIKKEGGMPKYDDPINQIQDQIGARIITFYLEDVEAVSRTIEEYYRPVEKVNIVPDSEKEFGYEGKHYILFIPQAVLPKDMAEGGPKFFELQIKTLFQHAWSEAEHDLGYKAARTLTLEEKRKIAFTAAQAWGADIIFSELSRLQK